MFSSLLIFTLRFSRGFLAKKKYYVWFLNAENEWHFKKPGWKLLGYNQQRGVLRIIFNWSWRKLTFATHYITVQVQVQRRVRVFVYSKCVSRNFMIFHCISFAFFSAAFEEFECLWRNEGAYKFSCTHCTIRALISYEGRAHSAVVAAFSHFPFVFLIVFPFHFCMVGHTVKIINKILFVSCQFISSSGSVLLCSARRPHYHSNYNQHAHRQATVLWYWNSKESGKIRANALLPIVRVWDVRALFSAQIANHFCSLSFNRRFP